MTKKPAWMAGFFYGVGFRSCLRSAARRGLLHGEYKLKMLMYHLYIPLFRSFSPCLALAREIVSRFLERQQRGHHAAVFRQQNIEGTAGGLGIHGFHADAGGGQRGGQPRVAEA